MDGVLILGGVIITLLVEFLKKWQGTKGWGTAMIAVVLSLVAGSGYMLLTTFGYWDATLQLLTTSSAFYALIVKNIKS